MNVPNRYKGFSQLPENVQQRMDPSLANKYENGGEAASKKQQIIDKAVELFGDASELSISKVIELFSNAVIPGVTEGGLASQGLDYVQDLYGSAVDGFPAYKERVGKSMEENQKRYNESTRNDGFEDLYDMANQLPGGIVQSVAEAARGTGNVAKTILGYNEGGSVMQRPLFRQMGSPVGGITDLLR